MDSFLILVDAGYVYAAAGTLIHGTTARRELLLNHGALRNHLESFGREETGTSMLRLYWYDAAPNRMPTSELLESAETIRSDGIALPTVAVMPECIPAKIE